MTLEQAIHQQRRNFWKAIQSKAVPDSGIDLRRPTSPVKGGFKAERSKIIIEGQLLLKEEVIAHRRAQIQKRLDEMDAAARRAAAERAALEGRDWLMVSSRFPSISDIAKVVCHEFNIRKLDLLAHRRTRDVAVPRHIVVWIARKHTLLSFPQIGKALGGRDHTTSLNSYRVIERNRAVDADLQARLDRLCKELGLATE
jgi:chromosomal replication initiation ATPase DnaA